ncbi:MAG: leucine--tRNA ligase, partial [Bacilli bacterium]|nr:leucine--tRNA ligase [Bacilli bacterium]
DTIYGATFMVIAPEHDLVKEHKHRIVNISEVEDYIEKAKLKSEFERIQLVKEKTGVRLEGLEAINPLNKKKIPIFIADYVMITYGTGAIMAVPGHDERDYEFAKKYDLEIVEVIKGGDISEAAYTDTENGILLNSPILNDLLVPQAIKKMISYLEENGIGEKAMQFKMKDWAFNRQRYWGEPIPIIYCDHCGVVPVPYEDLPVTLPMVDKFMPTDTGESPLANIPEFVNCECPICHRPAQRETDTMPQWAGSSWYFLRYMDPKNHETIASQDKLDYWGQVDWYNGGMEHVTRHLIYSRFWNQFLHDINVVPFSEPYRKRTAQGLILGADGEKMSKSKGNVINPMDIIDEYGADTLRTYILFIGDYEMPTPWNENGVKGCRRFLDKVWRLMPKVAKDTEVPQSIEQALHKAIQGVSEDIENLKFNTAIAKLMTFVNELQPLETIPESIYHALLLLMNPFAPHLAEELNEMLGNKESLVFEKWPIHDPAKLVERTVEIVVSINGKVRDKITIATGTDQPTVEKLALELEKIKDLTSGKPIRKVIYVQDKLINLVI